MKINEFLRNRKTMIVIVCVGLVAVMLVIHSIITNSILSADSGDDFIPNSNINPRYNEIMKKGSDALTQDTSSMAESTVSTAASESKSDATGTASTAPSTATTKPTKSAGIPAVTAAPGQTVPYATAVPPASPADYSEQWNKGYLLAIDNPDTSYVCAKVTLSDEDRDLLERLCYGEFGSGGFLGASLIAQCVKDAMCFEGYSPVAEVISGNRYDGSTDEGTSDECRQAVRYIFDENHDAVQHRILYMYNPYMVQSTFHESQNFILSYSGVRFFDRWAA